MTKQPVTELDTNKLLVAPSLLAADFANLKNELKRIKDAGAEILHLDIMDGHFVPNLTMGPPLIKSLRKISDLVFDAHLMITDPLKYIKPFADAGADHITFHLESNGDPDEIIEAIRAEGCSVGICLKPGTDASAAIPYLDKIDLVLIMTVEPGFGGQSFMADMMPKVKTLKEAISKVSNPVHLEVDGGLDSETVVQASKAGANMIVAGTSVFRHKDGADIAVKLLHDSQKYL